MNRIQNVGEQETFIAFNNLTMNNIFHPGFPIIMGDDCYGCNFEISNSNLVNITTFVRPFLIRGSSNIFMNNQV